MSAPELALTTPAVEEKAMEALLLDSGRWRVGPHGVIEWSKHNGKWTAQPSGVKADLYAVSGVNQWVGWVVGQQGTILRTEDSGRSWKKVQFPNRDDLLRVKTRDWESAQVTTRGGIVYATSDGGKTWTVIRRP